MTSPINNTSRSTSEALSNKPSATKNKQSTTDSNTQSPTQASSNADTVSLSAASTQVRELQNRLADIPEVDAERVAQIKQEIANGNYPLDAKAIAANLLSLEKALSE